MPKADHWNLSPQHVSTDQMTFTLAYVRNIGERIYPGEIYGFSACGRGSLLLWRTCQRPLCGFAGRDVFCSRSEPSLLQSLHHFRQWSHCRCRDQNITSGILPGNILPISLWFYGGSGINVDFLSAMQGGLFLKKRSLKHLPSVYTNSGTAMGAMAALHAGRFDSFVIISGDGDFTGLAPTVRERERPIFVSGKTTAPALLRHACTEFHVIEDASIMSAAKGGDSAERWKTGILETNGIEG